MNILEDYISWGWDVTKGEQFWEPTVSEIFKSFEIVNFFSNSAEFNIVSL